MPEFAPHGDIRFRWEAPLLWIYADQPVNLEAVKISFEEVTSQLRKDGFPSFVEIITLGPQALMTPDALELIKKMSISSVFKNRLAVVSIINQDSEFSGALVKELHKGVQENLGAINHFVKDEDEARSVALELYQALIKDKTTN